MDFVKIMPCLDMKNGKVVKGVHFVDLKEAGDPVQNAAFYQKEGADELAMLDIAATIENRKTRLDWVKQVSSVISIPLTVGGGINSLEDIQLVLDAGANKISMNSAACTIGLIKKQQIASIREHYYCYRCKENAALASGLNLLCREDQPTGKCGRMGKVCEGLGAGVILPTSMDGDGTLAGCGLDLPDHFDAVNVPVVASGGAGTLEHFEGVTKGGAQILLAASVFHYRTLSIKQVKTYLFEKGLKVTFH